MIKKPGQPLVPKPQNRHRIGLQFDDVRQFECLTISFLNLKASGV